MALLLACGGGGLVLLVGLVLAVRTHSAGGGGILGGSGATGATSDLCRDTVLSYLAQPLFAGDRLERQVLGDAHLELLVLDKREAYFSLPASLTEAQRQQARSRFLVDTTRIDEATHGTGTIQFGGFSFRLPLDRGGLFKTAVDNVRIAGDSVLRFPFRHATYTLTLQELADFCTNRSILGGPLRQLAPAKQQGYDWRVFANHAALVARPEEPSLRRFVEELTKDVSARDPAAREKRIQRVLHVVTEEIDYNLREGVSRREVLKRPNEVLMTANGDCSNKVILLASLLQVLREDVLLLYVPKHITVGVRQGGFPGSNGLAFQWQRENWTIAETTVSGFRIGVDQTSLDDDLKKLEYVQRPAEKGVVYDARTGEKLSYH